MKFSPVLCAAAFTFAASFVGTTPAFAVCAAGCAELTAPGQANFCMCPQPMICHKLLPMNEDGTGGGMIEVPCDNKAIGTTTPGTTRLNSSERAGESTNFATPVGTPQTSITQPVGTVQPSFTQPVGTPQTSFTGSGGTATPAPKGQRLHDMVDERDKRTIARLCHPPTHAVVANGIVQCVGNEAGMTNAPQICWRAIPGSCKSRCGLPPNDLPCMCDWEPYNCSSSPSY